MLKTSASEGGINFSKYERIPVHVEGGRTSTLVPVPPPPHQADILSRNLAAKFPHRPSMIGSKRSRVGQEGAWKGQEGAGGGQ